MGYQVQSRQDRLAHMRQEVEAMDLKLEDGSAVRNRYLELEEEMEALDRREKKAELQRKILQHIKVRDSGVGRWG